MSIQTKLKTIDGYCDEIQTFMKDIKQEINDVDDQFDSLQFIELRISRAMETIENMLTTVLKAYDEIEE